jgi:hypothetical protein
MATKKSTKKKKEPENTKVIGKDIVEFTTPDGMRAHDRVDYPVLSVQTHKPGQCHVYTSRHSVFIVDEPYLAVIEKLGWKVAG